MATSQPICANQAPDNTKCNNTGRFACKNCLLITYCGPECQKSHWAMHKLDCKSRLGKEGWQPGWVLENRNPAFVGDGPPQMAYGGGKYLWGNVPAFDVLQLSVNEGVSYNEQLRILVAASGDLRNIVKTIAKLPNSYTQPIEVTINDRDLDIVARNAIMLLIALVVDDVDVAADCIIHDDLLFFTDTPKGLTANQAHEIRKAVTLAEGRKDYRDYHLLLQSPSHRIALTRFREDGLLLPFGAARDAFRHPNPTIYQETSWPMYDNADPLNGWSAKDVQETQTGPATADIYGKLFTSLRTVLRAFLRRLSSSQTSFRLFYMDASALPKFLENSTFSRIEVSNISDAGYLGIHHTLDLTIPLL
ncbi:mynd finger family protein [Colletotrichum kahawae]|uniref:Mynd finger family protein n=1 Tax=Colletotrichum kahawae TaxID=34407 RepID=A0AAD9YEM2_COLKA|nr:mynd finger family protein [Colletotrichum kahawae]